MTITFGFLVDFSGERRSRERQQNEKGQESFHGAFVFDWRRVMGW